VFDTDLIYLINFPIKLLEEFTYKLQKKLMMRCHRTYKEKLISSFRSKIKLINYIALPRPITCFE